MNEPGTTNAQTTPVSGDSGVGGWLAKFVYEGLVYAVGYRVGPEYYVDSLWPSVDGKEQYRAAVATLSLHRVGFDGRGGGRVSTHWAVVGRTLGYRSERAYEEAGWQILRELFQELLAEPQPSAVPEEVSGLCGHLMVSLELAALDFFRNLRAGPLPGTGRDRR